MKGKDISQAHRIGYVAAKSLGHKQNMFQQARLGKPLESNTEVPSKIGLLTSPFPKASMETAQAYLSAESKVGWTSENRITHLCHALRKLSIQKKVNLQNAICSLERLEEGKLYISKRVFPLKWILSRRTPFQVFFWKHNFGYRDPCRIWAL